MPSTFSPARSAAPSLAPPPPPALRPQPVRVPRRTLMGPGPSDVPASVLQALAQPTVSHRDPAFTALMEEIQALVRYAFRTQNRLTLPVSGPGTAGMETCVANLVAPGDTVVVCVNGLFGERMKAMAARCGATVVPVETPWGRAIDPEALDDALAAHPEASLVAFVHAETSTGVLSDAEALAAVARRHDCLTLVDAVTSLGGVPVETDAWGLDAVYASAQRCLSCAPGLALLTLSPRAEAALRGRATDVQSGRMDLRPAARAGEAPDEAAFAPTAPVNALYGLHEALRRLHAEGLEAAWARHRRLHAALRTGLQALGLRLVVPPAERTPQLSLVAVPEGLDEAAVRAAMLHAHGLEIGAGLGPLAGQVWRIGLMGHSARLGNVYRCLNVLGETLTRHGHAADGPAAVEATAAYLTRVQTASGDGAARPAMLA
jgi:alanine-glyoxylate transaminase/serine-glyoxylate transaminase/serine-pyruvate transaminase